jgi:hypothetical protein
VLILSSIAAMHAADRPNVLQLYAESQVGIIVIGKGLVPVYVSFTYFLNKNATYQETIAVHGHIDGSSTEDMSFAVVGGTGDFLYVTGEDRAKFTAGADVMDPSNVVNVHNLTLLYHQ